MLREEGGKPPFKEHVKPYSVQVWLKDCVCCGRYSVRLCPGGREMGLMKKHGDSWGAVVLGVPRRKDLALSEVQERKELCYLARGDVWVSCLNPWQWSEVRLLKERLETCAREELLQY